MFKKINKLIFSTTKSFDKVGESAVQRSENRDDIQTEYSVQQIFDLIERQTILESQNKFLEESLHKQKLLQSTANRTGFFQVREIRNEESIIPEQSNNLSITFRLESYNTNFDEIIGAELNLKNLEFTPNQLIHSSDFNAFCLLHNNARQHLISFRWKGRISVSDRLLWVQLEVFPILLDNKDIVWSGTIQNTSIPTIQDEYINTSKPADEDTSNAHSFKLEDILLNANVGTLEWNIQTGKIKFNKIWARNLGYSTTEIKLGTVIFGSKGWQVFTHPDDVEYASKMLDLHFSGKLPHYSVEVRMKHRKGHWVWIRQEGKVKTWTPDGKPLIMYGTHTDITQQKKAEEELNNLNVELEKRVAIRTAELESLNADLYKTQEKFQTLTDFTYDWEYWKGTSNNIVFMTTSVERITGYTALEFEENPDLLDQIVFKADQHLWDDHKKMRCTSLPNENSIELIFRIVKKNGEIRWIGHVCRCIVKNGLHLGERVSNRDITDKVAAEKALLDITVNVEERERNRFSRDIHDGLGPLLSTVKLYFEWLADTDDEQKRKMIIEKGSHCLETAIQTARELARGMNSQMLIKSGYVIAIQQFAHQINETSKINISFESNTDQRFDVFLEIALYRISTELIKNTLTYAHASSVHIRFVLNEVTNKLMFNYTDNGIGFDVDQHINNNNGLGIHNIEQRVQILKGKIAINSQPNNGMQVSIELPIEDK